MRTAIVIPARYASSRLPGKPLADLHGKPIIQHVFERAREVPEAERVVVATDDERVRAVAAGFGAEVVMTDPEHASGTDRLVEVMADIEADLYVNLQGDEPLIRPADISLLIRGMHDDPAARVGTLCHPIDARGATNPNCVKVVRGANHEALYFSRSPIPYPRDPDAAHYLKHVGIYAFRQGVLAEYSRLPHAALEQAEGLEQLRLMHAGFRLHAFEVAPTAPGVDTPRCLERVRAIAAGLPDPAEQNPLATVELVITDVDGVLTDGGLYYDADGECLKRFHARDGLGMRMLEETGIQVALLSGRDSPTLRRRAADLGIHHQRFGVSDKAAACRAIMADAGVDAERTAYVGDDSIDLPAFAVCGMAFAVADAPAYVRRRATDVLESRGGEAAFRELVDAILIARDQAHVFDSADGFRRAVADTSQ